MDKKLELVKDLYCLLHIEEQLERLQVQQKELREKVGVDLYASLQKRANDLKFEDPYPDEFYQEVEVKDCELV